MKRPPKIHLSIETLRKAGSHLCPTIVISFAYRCVSLARIRSSEHLKRNNILLQPHSLPDVIHRSYRESVSDEKYRGPAGTHLRELAVGLFSGLRSSVLGRGEWPYPGDRFEACTACSWRPSGDQQILTFEVEAEPHRNLVARGLKRASRGSEKVRDGSIRLWWVDGWHSPSAAAALFRSIAPGDG